ncbi:hypothetical protein E5329_10550 [Petralouisia muris]|uniref:Uncharacterized protein n=1 Tax=Petralouisia muris TaxID=3032872 RepID=A0AC61RX85_9FIRM|nr:hypothetical protein [Petralouisia muris]TGY96278.1 hypothetical protein E5329_10550 [Petralouisia muris]
MNIMNPQTAVTKRKTGDLTVDITQVIRNITGTETDENKKSVLQKLLEPKEVDKNERDARKILQIAKRIARGESVSPEEKELLRRLNPQLAQMAELARKEGERIKHALKQASSKEEQQTIIGQAYQQVAAVMKKNPQFGELLGEAVKAAIKDVQEDPAAMNKPKVERAGGEEESANQPKDQTVMDEAQAMNPLEKEKSEAADDRQEEILEQFYPEEWVSMLDCKG